MLIYTRNNEKKLEGILAQIKIRLNRQRIQKTSDVTKNSRRAQDLYKIKPIQPGQRQWKDIVGTGKENITISPKDEKTSSTPTRRSDLLGVSYHIIIISNFQNSFYVSSRSFYLW